jgi:uncharacterized protein (DUF2141 family)
MLAVMFWGATLPTWAATDLVVNVTGIAPPLGEVGCSLYSRAAGFPMDSSKARQQWQSAQTGEVSCRFAEIAEGRYAVTIGHDVNGNRRVDTNFIGLPTEQWGVSNNVRPSLRAPRFTEAVFVVPPNSTEYVVTIEVAK